MIVFELDHLFICSTINAPEATQLINVGLIEGTSRIHPGQGTANRRFFFHNLMLELLWVHDSDEAKAEGIRQTHLWERWDGCDRSTCPFGICLRPTASPPPLEHLPFPTWHYRPPYLPPSLSIPVATNIDVLTEPMLFYLPFAQRQDIHPEGKAQPLQHPIGFREVTGVTLISPHADSPSDELQALVASGLVQLQLGSAYRLILDFDGVSQGHELSLQPTLPLCFRW